MAYLEINNVSKSFGANGARVEVLKDINLSVEKGEFVAIVGYSGAGKTTLINLIAGLVRPDSGSLRLNDLEITAPGPDRGIVFQNYSLLPWLTVFENIFLAVEQCFPNWSKAKKTGHVEKYIAMVNLTPAREKRPAELSGGMRQRVSVARALAYGSGDSNPTDGKHETFENLFPTNHKFYGCMDFVSLQNIHDVRGIFQIKPHPRLSIAFEGHGFWLADTSDNFYNVGGAPRGGTGATPLGNGYGINPTYDRFVGTELDVIAGYALTRYAQIEVGYGHFFVGDYIKQSLSNAAFGSTDADYVYVQASINF